MQTEPIGFKGTKGEIKIFSPYIDEPKTLWFGNQEIRLKLSYSSYNGAVYPTQEQKEANRNLLAASKKMAIALQQICELSQTIGDAYEMQKIAKEALKEAGLSPDQYNY